MRIWIVQISEALPTDSGSPRLQRAGLLAEHLHRRGHEVVFWATTFQYRSRTFRASRETRVAHLPGYDVHLLHAGGYSTNISVGRLRYHGRVARAFARAITLAPPPDLILCSYPTIETSEVAVQYGRRRGIPVLLDVRDMWPDIFTRLVPSAFGILGRLSARVALMPMVAAARRAFSGAAGITGNTDRMVRWGLTYAGRDWEGNDGAFPHGYAERTLSAEARMGAASLLRSRGIDVDAPEFRVVFFGLFARAPEFETVLAAAARLAALRPRIRFILCGSGPREEEIRQRASVLPNVDVPGWIDGDTIWALMERSHVGLLCYHSTFDFEASIPNKPIEYMAGGLPVLSSLERGVLKEMLEREGCGLTYRNGDPDGLVAQLLHLHDDEGRRLDMSRRARDLFEREFEASRVYDRFARHLEAVAG